MKLGKKLISELKLKNSVNTLAKWMAYYLAELITDIEKSSSDAEKKQLKRECCQIIIQLWEIRERIPIEKPTERLKPIIDVLELFKQRKHPFVSFTFFKNEIDTESKNWVDFLGVIKLSSEEIFKKSLTSMIDKKVLEKDNEWVVKHGEFLTKQEKNIVEYLNEINSSRIKVVFQDSKNNNEHEISTQLKNELLFAELENLIDEQKKALTSLKKTILK